MPGNDCESHRASMAAPGRAATPAGLAPIVVFLAASDSGWILGKTFYATGGVR
jgi:NAD(P)-dependent dehydrogenase (short-subunit alcohol dehydrogenase family)